MHIIIIINYILIIIFLGLFVVLNLYIKDLYFDIKQSLQKIYTNNERRFINNIYKHSLSKNYNRYLFVLTGVLTFLLREIYLIVIYVYTDLANIDEKQLSKFIYTITAYPDIATQTFLLSYCFLLVLILTLRLVSIFGWKILKILYFPEWFKKP